MWCTHNLTWLAHVPVGVANYVQWSIFPDVSNTGDLGRLQGRTVLTAEDKSAVAPISPPTPGHYHVLYRGCGEMQLGRHRETYFLVGGYRVYGDVALAMPAKVEAEKPVPRRAPKRNHAPERSDKDLGFPRPKIRRLKHSSSSGIQDVPLATPAKVEAEKSVPRRALKRKHTLGMLDKDLGYPRPKIRQLQHAARRRTPQNLAGEPS
nr:uncharacterized protein LOC115843367 [Globicephala melas]